MARNGIYADACFPSWRSVLTHIASAFVILTHTYRLVFPLGIALMLFGIGVGAPAETSDWIPTGELNGARARHTATRLLDGRVLVTGGQSTEGFLRSSELYDPGTGTWRPAADLNVGRSYHRAVILHDGRVLVTGGWTDQSLEQTASSEVYDPATDEWTQVGDLNLARRSHTATVLQDGRVLVAGGASREEFVGEVLAASAEVFDPTTMTWTLTGQLNSGRCFHTSTPLAVGRVLVSGGSGYEDQAGFEQMLTSAEIYDPVTGVWTLTDELIFPRAYHTSTRLLDGSVLAVGGWAYEYSSRAAEIFALPTETWSLTEFLTWPRHAHTATLLADGTVLTVGGQIPGAEGQVTVSLWSTELYDAESGTWILDGDLGTARYEHTATLLGDGHVLVAGGVLETLDPLDRFKVLASAELHPGAGDPLSVSLTLSATSFGPGDTLNVALEAFSAEQGFMTDVYFCALMPDGQSLAFIIDTAAPDFVVTRLDADARSFVALYENLRIPLGFAYRDESFFSYTFPDGLPEGNYTLFLGLIPPGALDDGLLDPSDFLELESQNFAYQQ